MVRQWVKFIWIIGAVGLNACTSALPPAATPVADPVYSISVVSGNGQVTPPNTQLPRYMVVFVTDQKGNPVQNKKVNWAISSGPGTLLTPQSTTDPQGKVPANIIYTSAGSTVVTATIDGTSSSVTFSETSVIGAPSASNCSIIGSSPVENDGVNFSTITVSIRDSGNNGISGVTPTFTATGSSNTYVGCSATNASGISTCKLKSTTPETKILSLTAPLAIVGGTVVFAPGAVSSSNSTISGSGPVVANGTSASTVTITLRDASSVAVPGVVPTFSATDTGASNTYGACSATNASGVSTCSLTSTTAESKTLSITSPISAVGGSVQFTVGAASASTSSITGTGPVEPDGSSISNITIILKDSYNNAISGVTPAFSATNTGTTNTYGSCSVTNAIGSSICSLSSLTAELKVLSLVTPIAFNGGTVTFAHSAVTAANSSISGTTNILADGTSTSTVTITLRDASNVPVGGVVPAFSATGSGNGYGSCSTSSPSTGVSTCTLTSTHAESKTLSITSPVSKSGGSVVFNPLPPSAATSTISGTTSVISDGVSTSTITITLLDSASNPVAGVVPTFSATDTGSTNHYNVCSVTDASGVSTCTMTSTHAEVKSLNLLTPVSRTQGPITFIAGTASSSTCTITGSGPVVPDGTSASTISIRILDAYSNPLSGVTPTFTATNTGSNNQYSACSVTNALGSSTCTLKSGTAETKTLRLTSPVTLNGGTVVFSAGAASATYSSITGSSNVLANGSATSSISIVLKDSNNIALQGTVPTFSATNTGGGNTYSGCTATDATGTSYCTLASTKAETKTLQIASPISLIGGTVTFIAGSPSASTSQITGTSPVAANGTATSTITVVLYDAYNNPVAGTTPTFGATDTGSTNIYGNCSATNASGASSCTLASLKAESKTLTLASPISVVGASVIFTAGAASASNSTITGSGPVLADGVASSTITITLKDAYNNLVSGVTPTFTATNTGATNVYGTCSSSSSLGVSTCSLKSTKAETKTLSISAPVSVSGGTVIFSQTASATYSSISGTGPVAADGSSTSTISVTLKDAANTAIVGTVPTFDATNTGSTNSYGTCTATNGVGVATCTLASQNAETKTLRIVTPIVLSGSTVVFSQAASASNSTATGTSPVIANGTATSTITITIRDYANTPISGLTPVFTATDSGSTNVYTACSSTNASGVSTCTMKSMKPEDKTLWVSSPVSFTGGTVSFVAGPAVAAKSTISGTGPTSADGTTASTITIRLKDVNNNPVIGTTPNFSATDTGTTNGYGACSATDSTGTSTCTLTSTKVETKTLTLTSPVNVVGGTVSFVQAVCPTYSSIVGTGPVGADGSASSTVTITLKDYSNASISGVRPTFTATNTGGYNVYGTCSNTNGSGVSTCTFQSLKAETKTLSLATPIVMSGGSVTFTPVADSGNSSISGTGPVSANGVATSTVTIVLKDYTNSPLVGTVPTFSVNGGGSSYGSCSSTDATGTSTCTLRSTSTGTKTLTVTAPINFSGGTVTFY